jgi:hypothetical protein
MEPIERFFLAAPLTEAPDAHTACAAPTAIRKTTAPPPQNGDAALGGRQRHRKHELLILRALQSLECHDGQARFFVWAVLKEALALSEPLRGSKLIENGKAPNSNAHCGRRPTRVMSAPGGC